MSTTLDTTYLNRRLAAARAQACFSRVRSAIQGHTEPMFGISRPGYCPLVIWFILILLVFGFLFGLLARAVVPGDDSMSLLQTWALGVGGSLLGGFLGAVIFGFDSEDGALQAGGLVGSIVGSILLLLIVRFIRSRRS